MLLQLPTYGVFADLPGGILWTVLALAVLTAGFRGAPIWLWTAGIAAGMWTLGAPTWTWFAVVPPLAILAVPPIRRAVLTNRIFAFINSAQLFPVISETERVAIEAGNVWVDGELFSGKPNVRHLSNTPYPELTEEEQAFLDGPVAKVCEMTVEWDVHQQRDLPPEVWQFLKDEGFFGMIIPKRFGGLGFSANAHSAVVHALASRSLPLAITVMVPNSLGPAELLVHGGTQQQKDYYLPRLARGEELPCFALTEPNAGSDAGAIQANGVVFEDEDGNVKIRLNWNKRYITLAAISTLLGLAFKLEDPDEILGRGKKPGITCALVPTSLPGVDITRRHDPLGIPFYNCPTTGTNVEVSIDDVIGGEQGVGHGWRMLMECLAAGRGISLPATSTGGAKMVARTVGAYAAVRKQFGLSIGKFEGIEEPLARIAGFTYLMEGARRYIVGGLDAGSKPPVVTAMAKYQFTELYRQIINDGMDVCGGAAISRGPNNLLSTGYTGAPISITVEGANILTRTLMVFGQGAIRCHPYAFREIEAAAKGDRVAFDHAFWGHIGHVVRNGFRSVLLSLTRGRLATSPVGGPAAPYWRRLAWASASFALFADLAMAGLGGNLKRKEKITGRYADVFAWMLLATTTLRRFAADGCRKEDIPLMQWACEHAFAQMQIGFQGLLQNLRMPGAFLLRGPVRLWSRLNPIGAAPSDWLGGKVARTLLEPGAQRDALTAGCHVPQDASVGLGRLERAFQLCTEAEPIQKKIKDAVRAKTISKGSPARMVEQAREKGVISESEVAVLKTAEAARDEAIQVDSFTLDEYRTREASSEEATVSST